MNASRFVGRVRGLAAVLGAGAVLSLGQGVAWADDDGSQHPRGSSDSPRSHVHRPAAAGGRTPSARPASAVAESGNVAGTARLGAARGRLVDPEEDSGETPSALWAPNSTGNAGSNPLPAAATGQRVSTGRHVTPAAARAVTIDVGPGPTGAQTGPMAEVPSATGPDGGARLSPAAALASGAVGSAVPDPIASNTSTTAVAPAATLAATASVAPKAIAAAASAPITLKVIVADMLTWAGLGRLVPIAPVPALPMPPAIETLWLAVRNALGKPDNIYLLGPQITLSGVEFGQVLTADGTRAVITTEVTDPRYSTSVTVVDMMSGKQVGTTLKFDGPQQGAAVVTTDGSRAVIVTSNRQAVVIDTATGQRIGAVALSRDLGYDGRVVAIGATRAVVATIVPDDALTVYHTQFAVIDTTTGKQIGVEGTVPGRAQWWFSVDADHVLLVSEENRPDNELSTPRRTQVVVLDTAAGTQSSPVTLLGLPDERPLLSPDGSRVLITADSPLVDQAQMAVIDTVTGAQIGSTTTFDNRHLYGAVGVGDGSRALITMTTYDPATGKRRGGEALVIDTATGEQVGATATFSSTPEWSLLSADGAHALIAYTGGAEILDTVTGTSTALASGLAGTPKSFVPNRDGTRALIAVTVPGSPGYYPERPGTTQVTVIDTVTGTQIGTAISVPGNASGVVPSADGTRALIMTNVGLWAVFDTTTGQQIGATKFKPGFILSDGLARSDGTHVLAASALSISRLTMVDIVTGRPVGNTVTIPGDGGIADTDWSVSADGSRALFSSYFRGTPGRTVIQVLGLGSL